MYPRWGRRGLPFLAAARAAAEGIGRRSPAFRARRTFPASASAHTQSAPLCPSSQIADAHHARRG